MQKSQNHVWKLIKNKISAVIADILSIKRQASSASHGENEFEYSLVTYCEKWCYDFKFVGDWRSEMLYCLLCKAMVSL